MFSVAIHPNYRQTMAQVHARNQDFPEAHIMKATDENWLYLSLQVKLNYTSLKLSAFGPLFFLCLM